MLSNTNARFLVLGYSSRLLTECASWLSCEEQRLSFFAAALFNVEVVFSLMLPSSSKSVKRKRESATKTKTTTSPGLKSFSVATRSHPWSHCGSLLAAPNETLHVRPSSFSKVTTLPNLLKCSLTNGDSTVCSETFPHRNISVQQNSR